MRVAVVGGGIGGLAAALALLRRGIDVEVYEQAPALKEVGAGIQLAPNCVRALYELGLEPALAPLACETAGKEVRMWNTGETWKLFDLGAEAVQRYGYPYLMVHRPDLLQVLADAVRERIHLGARFSGFEQDASGVKVPPCAIGTRLLRRRTGGHEGGREALARFLSGGVQGVRKR